VGARDDRCPTVLITFVHVMVAAAQIIPLGEPVAPITHQLLRYQWVQHEDLAQWHNLTFEPGGKLS